MIAQNGLAYGNAGLRQWDAAIAAAKKQVELLPKEPNPADTLGEISLLAGKLEDRGSRSRAPTVATGKARSRRTPSGRPTRPVPTVYIATQLPKK